MGDLNERMAELRRRIPKDIYGLTTDQGDNGMLHALHRDQTSTGDDNRISQTEVPQSDPIKSDAERLAEARDLLAQVLSPDTVIEPDPVNSVGVPNDIPEHVLMDREHFFRADYEDGITRPDYTHADAIDR